LYFFKAYYILFKVLIPYWHTIFQMRLRSYICIVQYLKALSTDITEWSLNHSQDWHDFYLLQYCTACSILNLCLSILQDLFSFVQHNSSGVMVILGLVEKVGWGGTAGMLQWHWYELGQSIHCGCMPECRPWRNADWAQCRIFPLWEIIAISTLSSTYFLISATAYLWNCFQ